LNSSGWKSRRLSFIYISNFRTYDDRMINLINQTKDDSSDRSLISNIGLVIRTSHRKGKLSISLGEGNHDSKFSYTKNLNMIARIPLRPSPYKQKLQSTSCGRASRSVLKPTDVILVLPVSAQITETDSVDHES